MDNYIPPTLDWVREQVELYESSGGTKGTTLRDTGLPCIIITHRGGKTGATRKIPVMKVKQKDSVEFENKSILTNEQIRAGDGNVESITFREI